MKAKEYYTTYHDGILSDDGNKTIANFMNALKDEAFAIIEQRKVRTTDGLAAVFMEQNQKYNAVMSLFQKKDGFQPLIPDGFLIVWKQTDATLALAIDNYERRRRNRV